MKHPNDAARPGKDQPGDIAKYLTENSPDAENPEHAPFNLCLEEIVAVILFWATGVVIFLQFFTRYVLNNSFSWTEEIARYLLIGLTFIGAAAVVRRREHINLTYFADKLRPPARHVLDVVVNLIALSIFAALTWYSTQVANLIGNQPMASVSLSMGIVYWTVTAGFAAMTFRCLQTLYQIIRRLPD